MATPARPSVEATVSVRRPFRVVFTREAGGGYSASVEGLPGCFSEGQTLAAAKRNIREAIECHLEALAIVAGRRVKPTPTSRAKESKARPRDAKVSP
jgi:predicted RNase H-like HicB family nuclease